MLPYRKVFPLQNVLLGVGGHRLVLLRLHLHVLSCFAINVTTGVHVHSRNTECTMPDGGGGFITIFFNNFFLLFFGIIR